MTTLLQINASINKGQSSQLANQFVAAFHKRHPGAKIVVRDVAADNPVPHLDAERFGAFTTKKACPRRPCGAILAQPYAEHSHINPCHREPVVQYGPFVMNTREEIEQALADYRSGHLASAA